MIPRWEAYKHFFQITIFRYLVVWFSIVPVIANLVAPLPPQLKLWADGPFINLSLPFNWQLLWLSSLFFLCAWTIYLLRCPSFIKKYNQFGDYLSYNHDPRWIVWEAYYLVKAEIPRPSAWRKIRQKENPTLNKFVEVMERKKYLTVTRDNVISAVAEPHIEETQTKLYFPYGGKTYCFGMPLETSSENKEETLRGSFWEIFGRFSGSRFVARLIITILLGISGMFFVCVLLQHIAEGWSFLAKHYF